MLAWEIGRPEELNCLTDSYFCIALSYGDADSTALIYDG